MLDPSQLPQQSKDTEQKMNRDFYNILSSDSFMKNNLRETSANGQCRTHTEQLKTDLEEVEALTSRVRDSISLDLSSTRRHSSLLYEYYRQQLELARSIQSTYNIKFTNLFDAMNLMKKCFRDYCQTVHNPEYLAIETIDGFQLNNNDDMKSNLNKRTMLDDCYEKMDKLECMAKPKDASPWVSYELFENMKNDKKNLALTHVDSSLFSAVDDNKTQPSCFYSEIVKKTISQTNNNLINSNSRPSSFMFPGNKSRPELSVLDLAKQSATSDTLISILTSSNSRADNPASSAFIQPTNTNTNNLQPAYTAKPAIQFVDFENKQTYV